MSNRRDGFQNMALAVEQAQEIVDGVRGTGEVWHEWAACRGVDGDDEELGTFFSEGKITSTYYRNAFSLCEECPVAAECLAFAMQEERYYSQHNIFGVRGGLIPKDRIKLALRLGLRRRVLVEVR